MERPIILQMIRRSSPPRLALVLKWETTASEVDLRRRLVACVTEASKTKLQYQYNTDLRGDDRNGTRRLGFLADNRKQNRKRTLKFASPCPTPEKSGVIQEVHKSAAFLHRTDGAVLRGPTDAK